MSVVRLSSCSSSNMDHDFDDVDHVMILRKDKKKMNAVAAAAVAAATHPPSLYRDNGTAIYPFTVDVKSRDKNEQLIAVATALCPDLLCVSASQISSSKLRLQQECDDDGDDDAETAFDDQPPTSSCESSASSSCSTDEGEELDEANNSISITAHDDDDPLLVEKGQQVLLSVRPLLGGLSNELFVVENKVTRASVLVRIHPVVVADSDSADSASVVVDAAADIVDRNVENKLVAWLSSLQQHHHHEKHGSSDDDDAAAAVAAAVDDDDDMDDNVAPVFYGRFGNGRVEEFYHGVEPLTPALMHQCAAPIARLLGRLHARSVPRGIFSSTGTGNTDGGGGDNKNGNGSGLNNSNNGTIITPATTTTTRESPLFPPLRGAIWKRVDDWFGMATLASSHSSGSTSTTALSLLLRELQTEWSWLTRAFQRHYSFNDDDDSSAAVVSLDADEKEPVVAQQQARQFLYQVVLTHMDCQSLNLLRSSSICSSSSSSNDNNNNKSSPLKLRLIDYEYAGLNPRAADLANTFCEFCNMSGGSSSSGSALLPVCDFAAEYPSAATQNDFLRAYCQAIRSSSSSSSTTGTAQQEGRCEDDNGGGSSLSPQALAAALAFPSDALLAALRHEIGRYTLLSHLQWAVWSLVQHQNRQGSRSSSSTTVAALPSSSSSNVFDYVAYAQLRMVGYRHHKRLFWGTTTTTDGSSC